MLCPDQASSGPNTCHCGSSGSHSSTCPSCEADDWPSGDDIATSLPLLDAEETALLESLSPLSEQQIEADKSLCRSFRHSGWVDRRERTLRSLQVCGLPPARIERFQACGSSAFVLQSSADPPSYRIASNRCHDRFCVPCSTEHRRLVSQNLERILPQSHLRLLTVTLKGDDTPLLAKMQRARRCFALLRQRLSRRNLLHGGIAFVEITRNLSTKQWHPHIHAIIEGAFIQQQWLRDVWKEITGDSYIVDIRLIRDNHEAASYVLKYAGKAINSKVWSDHDSLCEAILALRGTRCFSCFGTWSQFRLSEVPTSDVVWEYFCPLSSLLRKYQDGDAKSRAILLQLTNWSINDPVPFDVLPSP